MKNPFCKPLYLLSLALGFVGLVSGASVAQAQTTDVYKVNYFANNTLTAPDETVRIDSPGLTSGSICAMIYVFDNDQQLTACGGCVLTHNGLRTLSVKKDLTYNPLTGKISNNGTIAIVSAAVNGGPTGCTASANVSPVANLRAWGTHTQNEIGSSYPITETEFLDSPLGATELANLQAQCAFIGVLGSGQGTIGCGSGD